MGARVTVSLPCVCTGSPCVVRPRTGKQTPGGAGTHTGHTDRRTSQPSQPTTHPRETARRPGISGRLKYGRSPGADRSPRFPAAESQKRGRPLRTRPSRLLLHRGEPETRTSQSTSITMNPTDSRARPVPVGLLNSERWRKRPSKRLVYFLLCVVVAKVSSLKWGGGPLGPVFDPWFALC